MSVTVRYRLDVAGLREDSDITVFDRSVRFRAADGATIDVATSAWEELGQPREIDVTVSRKASA